MSCILSLKYKLKEDFHYENETNENHYYTSHSSTYNQQHFHAYKLCAITGRNKIIFWYLVWPKLEARERIYSFGETVYVTVTPLNSSRVKDNSYKIAQTKPNRWKASFIISVKSNKLTSVSSPSVTALSGFVSSPVLRKVSSSQATLKFAWRASSTAINLSTGVKVIISNGELKVSIL